VLLGLGVGVGVGLLFAPARGDETRSNIKEKVRDSFYREKTPATGTHGG
jgi:gas vesicle protein